MAQTKSPKRLSRVEARALLSEELRPAFDNFCDDTLKWSKYYYGTSLISYSIIMELVKDGWRKT
jgi:hypothetical protein